MTVSETFIVKPTEEPFRLKERTSSDKLPLCPKCYEPSVLHPYQYGDNSTGKYFQCGTCNGIVSESQIKWSTHIDPLGRLGQQYDRKASYTPVPTNRRTKRNTSTFIPTENSIPLLAGKPDTELIGMLTGRPAIIASIVDSVGEEEEEY